MFDSNAIEKADKSLALIEQLEAVLDDMESFINELPKLYYQEGKPILERLKGFYEILNIDSTNIDALDLNWKPLKSKIERRRLSHEIIRLSEEEGLSHQAIADKVDLSRSTIQKFVKQYQQAKPSEKAKQRKDSIFQTYDQLERLSTLIYRELARYEGQDGNIHVKYIEQLRKLITEANQWMDRASERQKLEEIAMIVREVLTECTEDQEKLIAQRFEEIGLEGKMKQIGKG